MISCSGTIGWFIDYTIKQESIRSNSLEIIKNNSDDSSSFYCSHMTSSIKNYDFYRKAVDGLQTKSVYGGISNTTYYSLSYIVSILSAITISILTFSQLKSFLHPNTYSQLAIQDTMNQPVQTHIDILFNQLSCDCKQSTFKLILSYRYSLR